MDTITITFENGIKKEYRKGIKLEEIIKEVQKERKFPIISGKFKNQFINYEDSIEKSGPLYLYDINTKRGNMLYEKGLSIVFKKALLEVYGNDVKFKVKHSIDKGVYYEVDATITKENIQKIKEIMNEKIKKSIPFQKIETSRMEAINYFKSIKRPDKVKTLCYDTSKFVTLYKFDGIYDYIIGDLPNDSSILTAFDLTPLEHGIVLRFPSIYDNGKVVKYTHHEKYFTAIDDYSNWGTVLNMTSIGDLNDLIISSKSGEIIKLSEIIQDYKLLNTAERIVKNKADIKVILLSGPSSSGKTTTSKKLALYLKTLGLNPKPISLDDYFLNRDDTPLDENGKPDYESLRAIDVKLFNNQITKLLKGNKVTIPTYDFISGKKIYNRQLELAENDILIIEGLHALNEELLKDIPKKRKYKIYISPLAYLNIDNDNRINMTDIRLLRRIVRDNRVRGYSPTHTISTWSDVRKGEEKYVFPFQDLCDEIFNSSLAYELAVLKTYAEPLLFSVKQEDPEYEVALRLLELLKYVLPIPSDAVPDTSILREFIGGSYFE